MYFGNKILISAELLFIFAAKMSTEQQQVVQPQEPHAVTQLVGLNNDVLKFMCTISKKAGTLECIHNNLGITTGEMIHTAISSRMKN